MGYETRLEGEIVIEPPIRWSEIRESPFLEVNTLKASGRAKDIVFRVFETAVEQGDGTLIRKEAVALVPTHRRYAGRIVEHLQEVVDAFPRHTFAGRIDAYGEDTGESVPDVWRLKVVNRVATRFEPRLVWPDESE